MTHIKHLLTTALALFVVTAFSEGELCAAEATFTVVLKDYEVERDKKMVEAFDLTVTSLIDETRPLIRPSATTQVHDADKATLTIGVHYKDVPEGEYEVWYWIPSIAFRNKPYMEKFQLLSQDHFRKKLEFSTRNVVLKYQVDKQVMDLLPADKGSQLLITKLKESSKTGYRTLEYRFGGRIKKGIVDKAEMSLWLIPDGEYLLEFDPTWGHPIEVSFRIVDGKTVPEIITFSEENRVRPSSRKEKSQ